MPKKPSAWTNLQDYAAVNQDQGAQMGAKVAGSVDAQAGGAQKELQNANNDFERQKTAGSNVFDPNAAANGDIGTLNAHADNSVYGGPADINQTDPSLAGNVADAVQRVGASKTEAGRQGLLSDSYGVGGSASGAGGGALDSFLLSTGGSSAMQGLQDKYGTLGDRYQSSATASGAAAQQATQDTQANAAKWKAAAGTKQSGLDAIAAKQKSAKDAAEASVPDFAYHDPRRGVKGDGPQSQRDYMMFGVDQKDPKAVQARAEQIDQYMKAQQMTTQNQLDTTFNDINSVMSPINWLTDAAGIQDPTQHYAQQSMGYLSLDGQNSGAAGGGAKNASASGSTSAMHIPWDKAGADGFFVWKSMTPQDWQVLNAKPQNGPNGQLAWIATRAQQLRQKQQ